MARDVAVMSSYELCLPLLTVVAPLRLARILFNFRPLSIFVLLSAVAPFVGQLRRPRLLWPSVELAGCAAESDDQKRKLFAGLRVADWLRRPTFVEAV